MEKRRDLDVRMELADRHGLPPIQVSMESFFDFSFWIAESLDDLIASVEHQHGNAEDDRQSDHPDRKATLQMRRSDKRAKREWTG